MSTWQAHAAAGYESFGVTMETIPVFQRGGSIVAKKERARRSTTQMASDPYTLHVALDAGLRADGRLYVDDGQSLEYDTEKRYRLVELRFDAGRLDARFADDAGVFESDERVERVLVAGWPRAPRRVLRDDGSLVEFQYLSAQKVIFSSKKTLEHLFNEFSFDFQWITISFLVSTKFQPSRAPCCAESEWFLEPTLKIELNFYRVLPSFTGFY